jgi:hypothetical protein
VLIVVVLVLILAAILGTIRALLGGTLTLERVDEPARTVELPVRPFWQLPTDDLIGVTGRMFIAGIPFTRRMHIWIRCPGRPDGHGTLKPGGQRYVCGVWLTHGAAVPDVKPPEGVDRNDFPELWTTPGA